MSQSLGRVRGGQGAQASMAIVRPVSAFISVSLTASGAWSEMNVISPLMPMMPVRVSWRARYSQGRRVGLKKSPQPPSRPPQHLSPLLSPSVAVSLCRCVEHAPL